MIFGNWKMNTRREEAISLAHAIVQIAEKSTTQIGICPPSIWLDAVSRVTSESTVLLGGQDCIGDSLGSHTGCLNVELFDDIGIQAVILGHSERRARFGEAPARTCTTRRIISITLFPKRLLLPQTFLRQETRFQQARQKQL